MGRRSAVPRWRPMIATASSEMLAGVADAEPRRSWFGHGCCVEQHDDGTFAVFVRGELLGIYSAADVATRDTLIAVVRDQASREDLACAFRLSEATVGRVITRFNSGGFREVADYGRRGGRTVRTPKLERRLVELFERGVGPRAAHRDVAKKASYGTVYAIHQEWLASQAARAGESSPAPAQPELKLIGATSVEEVDESETSGAVQEQQAAPALEAADEPTLEAVAPAAGAVVQHAGSWMMLGLLNLLGFYELAAGCRGEVAMSSLRPAIDAVAIALSLGEKCIEGVRRIATSSAGTLLRHAGGLTASWARCVLHAFADAANKTFPGKVAARLLTRAGEGEARVRLYVDNHLRPYTGKHVVRKGWRMQDKRAVPGTSDYYVYRDGAVMLSMLRGARRSGLKGGAALYITTADRASLGSLTRDGRGEGRTDRARRSCPEAVHPHPPPRLAVRALPRRLLGGSPARRLRAQGAPPQRVADVTDGWVGEVVAQARD